MGGSSPNGLGGQASTPGNSILSGKSSPTANAQMTPNPTGAPIPNGSGGFYNPQNPAPVTSGGPVTSPGGLKTTGPTSGIGTVPVISPPTGTAAPAIGAPGSSAQIYGMGPGQQVVAPISSGGSATSLGGIQETAAPLQSTGPVYNPSYGSVIPSVSPLSGTGGPVPAPSTTTLSTGPVPAPAQTAQTNGLAGAGGLSNWNAPNFGSTAGTQTGK